MDSVGTSQVSQVSAPVSGANARRSASFLAERVREAACTFGCEGAWARAAGRHVILGVGEDEAFARVTPLGDHAYALAFRSPSRVDSEFESESTPTPPSATASAPAWRWEPLLLIDALTDVVEHALIGHGAIHELIAM